MSTTVLVTSFPPFPTVALSLPKCSTLRSISAHMPASFPDFSHADLALSTLAGVHLPLETPISALCEDQEYDEESRNETSLVTIRITPRLRGGKGGFGSQLRAAGGRMSSQKTNNNDSCRDLNGRRLSTIKEAKVLAAYLEAEPERKKAQQEAQRAKLEALERKLGIRGDGKNGKGGEPSTGAKRRFDDTEYLEQSKDIVDNVKSAVTVAMLKKKKKAKTTTDPSTMSTLPVARAPASTAEVAVEKLMEAPATAPVVAIVGVTAAAVGA